MAVTIPPKAAARGGAAVGGSAFLGWVAYTLIQLQTGQARLEERLEALRAQFRAHTAATAGPSSAHRWTGRATVEREERGHE